MPGAIMMGSMFILFVIEMYLNSKTGGHSHGGATGESLHSARSAGMAPPVPRRPSDYSAYPDAETEKDIAQRKYEEDARKRENPFLSGDEKAEESDMPTWFVVFYEQYVRQRLELINMVQAATQQQYGSAAPAALSDGPRFNGGPPLYSANDREAMVDFEGQPIDMAVYRKLSMNITLLEGGILFHSVFVGITVSLTNDGFLVLLIAILFHQMFEGLGLGSRIAEVPYPRRSIRPWVLVVAFGMTAPIGQAIGILARDTYDPNSAFGLIIVGVFNAM